MMAGHLHKSREPRVSCLNPEKPSRDLLQHVDKYNSRLGNHEQVKRFHLVTDNWTTENQFLTPTLKIKRKNISSFYQSTIADLFK